MDGAVRYPGARGGRKIRRTSRRLDYVLLEREVEVTARGEPGRPEQPRRTMTAPSYFGEIVALEGTPRTATVTACRWERIEGRELLEALAMTPPSSSSLMENARSRLALTHRWRRVTFEPGR